MLPLNLEGRDGLLNASRTLGRKIPRLVALLLILLTAALVRPAFAQGSYPVLAFLPYNGTVRPIYGSPSAGTIGSALSSSPTYANMAVSPSGAFALAAGDSGEIVVLTAAADGKSLRSMKVPGAIAGDIYLSPNGLVALSSKNGMIQVITGLPASPLVSRALDASPRGAVSALAVSDDGRWVAGVFGGTVYGFGDGSQAIPLPAPAGISALTFFHGRADLVATTASQIVKISDVGGAAAMSPLFGSADGPQPPESPMAIALTSDNAHIILLEPSGGLAQVDLANGAVRTANCACKALGLFGLAGTAFRLSNLAKGSIKVYDASSSRVVSFPLATPDPPWRDKQFPEWTEDDAKEVIADSPWVKKFTPTLDAKTTQPEKPRPEGRRRGGGIGIGGLGLGGHGGGVSTGTDRSNSAPAAPPSPSPTLTLRWESALPIREAELKARDVAAPAVDENSYVVALYGMSRGAIANDSKELANEFRKHAALKRYAKDDMKPSKVDILLRDDGPVVVYYFPKSMGITWRDAHIEFEAQVDKWKISQTFETADMRFHGEFEF